MLEAESLKKVSHLHKDASVYDPLRRWRHRSRRPSQLFDTRPTATRMGEESSLLKVAGVLHDVLLPRLAAVDLMRLGLTCKGMLKLVLSTPPSLWLVGPRNLYHYPIASLVIPV